MALEGTKHLPWFEFPLPSPHSEVLGLRQFNATLDHGTTVWDSAKALALHLHTIPALRGKSCIELGAGCGLVGLTAGARGAGSVHLTDLPSVVEQVLLPNVARNTPILQTENADLILSAGILDWLAPVSPVEETFDVIFAADCVYEQSLLQPLVSLIRSLASAKTILYVAFERRDTIVCDRFIDLLLQEGWEAKAVPKRKIKLLRVDNPDVEIWRVRCIDHPAVSA